MSDIMFNILETTACTDYVLGYYLSIVKTILTVLQIAAPIVFIISLVISFIKITATGDENKKIAKGIVKKIIAVIIFFLLPWMVNLVLGLIEVENVDTGARYTLGSCWENASELRKEVDNTHNDGVNKGSPTDLKPDNSSLENIEADDDTDTDTDTSGNSGNSSSSSSGGDNSSSGTTSNQTETPTKLIFIGDSRTVGMHNAVGGKDTWSCKSGEGLDWMKSTGVPQIEDKIDNKTGIIILMGVNDLYNADKYVTYINEQAKKWVAKGAKVYFNSVMPCKGSYANRNVSIQDFNKKLKVKLKNVKYINSYSYMTKQGFDSPDGLHYNAATYKKVYKYIKNRL